MGLLPNDIDILPASDDRVFKLLMVSPEGKPGLMDLIAATIGRPVVDVVVRNNELPIGDTDEKAERLDVNCRITDGSQINIESKEVLQMAGNLLMSVSQNERERAIFRSRRMYQSDMDSNIATAEARGKAERNVEIARNALRKNMSVEDIVDITGLTAEKVESLRKQLIQ